MFSFFSLPTYANDGDALLRFSMHVGSIMYVLFIVYLLVSNAKVRMMLFVVYLSLTALAYLFTLNTVFEFNILLTVFICIIIPLVITISLAIFVTLRRKT